MASLSEISIRRPVFAWMLMCALLMFGAMSFHRMGVSQLPDVDFPVVGVSLSLPGAAPAVMESQVLDPVEDAVMTIDGITNLTSTASQSSGSISIEFALGRNIDEAVQEVQSRIKQVQNMLPTGIQAPSVRKMNPEDQPILWLAVTSNDPNLKLIDLMIYARNTLYNQFATVDGVGDIAMGGYVDPALRVWVDIDKLKYYDLSISNVLTAIQNEQIELPAGRIENDKREYNVRVRGEASTPEDFGKIRIESRPGGINYRPTYLNQIAKIEEGTADVRKISRVNGQPAIALGILKQHGSNAVDVAERVLARLKQISPNVPKQFKVSVRSDQTTFIKQSVNQLTFTLILSAFLTSLICFLFLGSWTSTFNVLLAIPTSVVGAFTILYFFGFTLNTFTLLGLALAIGIVVDDAIMMLENIVRHQEMGESPIQAALKGSEEIKFAAIAATVAVCAIFLPVVFMRGVQGAYFYQFGITVTAAVLLSLLEALTLTPMRCSQYLTVNHSATGFAAKLDRFFNGLAGLYRATLVRLLNIPYIVLAVTAVLFVGSLALVRFIPSEMMPAQDQSMFVLRMKGPVGSSLDFTNEHMRKVEAWLAKQPEVEGTFSAVGGFGGDAVNQGQITVQLVDASKRKLSQKKIMENYRTALKEIAKPMRINGQDLSMRGFSPGRGFPVEFTVQGPDWDKLVEYTDKIIDAANDSGVLVEANSDVQSGMPEYQVTPDRAKLAAHGVTLTNVSSAMNSLVGGAILNGQVEYPKAGHRYQIDVRLLGSQRDRYEQLAEIQIPNNKGQMVPLKDLVNFQEGEGLMQISRLNRSRAIKVYANVAPGHSQQEGLKVAESLQKKILPPGYYVMLTGSAQSFKESMTDLRNALLLGILVSFMVLASQFNSFIHPIAVLMALPFSISGAFVALLITHQSLNMYSMIGFILLMGIVKKNSILLVDFTNHMRSQGAGVRDALVQACPVRLRPILMTSVATVAGALPEALSLGPGSETTIPMSVALIGGVIASTLLTLFCVPCAYIVLSRFEASKEIEIELSEMATTH